MLASLSAELETQERLAIEEHKSTLTIAREAHRREHQARAAAGQ